MGAFLAFRGSVPRRRREHAGLPRRVVFRDFLDECPVDVGDPADALDAVHARAGRRSGLLLWELDRSGPRRVQSAAMIWRNSHGVGDRRAPATQVLPRQRPGRRGGRQPSSRLDGDLDSVAEITRRERIMITLTDRYVASVLRLIPEAHREDIQAELKVAIEDAIDEKATYGQTHDAAERAVLNSLGEPARLAAEYSHRPLWLIGPDYYLAWLRLMKWLLWTLPVAVGAGAAALRLFVGDPALDSLWSGLVVALIVALNVAVWSTVGFIIVERVPATKPSDLGPLDRWSVKCLPATAIVDRQFSPIATIGGVVLNVFLIALLSSLLGLEDVSILNTSAWTISISVLIALLAASAVSRVIRYARGRWTLILAAAFAGWWWWALWNLSILDPQLIARLDAESGLLMWARSVVLVILAVCSWDAVSGFARRGRWTAIRQSWHLTSTNDNSELDALRRGRGPVRPDHPRPVESLALSFHGVWRQSEAG